MAIAMYFDEHGSKGRASGLAVTAADGDQAPRGTNAGSRNRLGHGSRLAEMT